MIVRAKLIGTGIPGDPYRVPFPTYMEVQPPDYVGMTHVISIPDSCHPFTPAQVAATPKVVVGPVQAIAALTAPQLNAWYQYLDGMYQEHAGAFRPVLA